MRTTQDENTDRKSQQAGRMATGSRDTRSNSDDQPRDAEGRFVDEDGPGSRRASQDNTNDDQPRDAQGRFKDDDDGQSGSQRRSASGRGDNDDQPRDSQGRFTDEDSSDTGSRSRN